MMRRCSWLPPKPVPRPPLRSPNPGPINMIRDMDSRDEGQVFLCLHSITHEEILDEGINGIYIHHPGDCPCLPAGRISLEYETIEFKGLGGRSLIDERILENLQ